MPPASWIKTESNRRAVIALVMFALLVGSTALAKFLADTLGIHLTPATVGVFQVGRPDDWQYDGQTDDHDSGNSAVFIEDGGQERRVLIDQVTTTVEHLPDEVLKLAIQSMTGSRARMLAREHLVAPSGAMGSGRMGQFLNQSGSGQGFWQPFTAAAMTIDGRKHLVLYMTGSIDADAPDLPLLSTMARSAVDRRFETVERSTIVFDRVQLHMPPSLRAMRRTDAADSSVYIWPKETDGFCRGRLWEVTAQAAPPAVTEDDAEAPTTAPPAVLNVPNVLGQLYSRATKQPLAIQQIQKVTVKDRTVYLVEPPPARRRIYRSWWYLPMDAEAAAVVELIAEPVLVGTARDVAVRLIGQMELVSHQTPTGASP